jgi:hypothetical protein
MDFLLGTFFFWELSFSFFLLCDVTTVVDGKFTSPGAPPRIPGQVVGNTEVVWRACLNNARGSEDASRQNVSRPPSLSLSVPLQLRMCVSHPSP